MTPSTNDQREQLASAFGRDIDPLAEYAPTFEETDVDPFDLFAREVLEPKNLAEKTIRFYRGAFGDWREYMRGHGRHPACPSEEHVRGFIRFQSDEKGNAPGTVSEKLQKLNKAYSYWQADNALPHPQDFNPFELARQKTDLSNPEKKPPHNIPIDRIREIVGDVTHVRDRAYIVLPLKLGLRASEVSNIQIADLSIPNPDLRDAFPEMGSHPGLGERENAIYVPSREERDGNKSRVPRILPLDEETRRIFLQWLLIRPDNGEPWMFLTKQTHDKTTRRGINDVWIDHFRPEYGETEQHRAVTSHFGRHYFTSFWRVKENAPRETVKYMRGDKTDALAPQGREAIDEYLHPRYDDVETLYRDRIFRLQV